MITKTLKILLVVLIVSAFVQTEKTYAQRVLIGPRISGNMNIYNQKGLTGTWNGFGVAVGGTVDVSFNKNVGLMANLNVFDMRNFKNSQTQGGVTTSQSYSLAYVTPEVMFKAEFSGFYLVAGPSFGINITNSGEVTQTATGQTPVTQTSDPEVNTMRFDIKTGAGYTFPIGSNMYLGTDFMVMIPVTDTYNFTGVSNSITTFQIGTALKFKI